MLTRDEAIPKLKVVRGRLEDALERVYSYEPAWRPSPASVRGATRLISEGWRNEDALFKGFSDCKHEVSMQMRFQDIPKRPRAQTSSNECRV